MRRPSIDELRPMGKCRPCPPRKSTPGFTSLSVDVRYRPSIVDGDAWL